MHDGARSNLLLLDGAAVRQALPMSEAIDAMRIAFIALTDGAAVQPHRLAMPVEGRGTAVAMAAFLPGVGLTGKLVTVFPGAADGSPATKAVCAVFDPDTGAVVALLEGTALTARRTGAAVGLATELLARPDARRGAVVGCGVTGREAMLAIDAVRDLDEIRVAARRPGSAAACVAAMGGRVRARLVAVDSVESAVRDADVVSVATTSREPVLHGAWLAPGCHVSSVGSFRLDMRELAADVFGGARVFVDHVDAVLAEAGHLVAAERAGVTMREDWIALGAALAGQTFGRRSHGERTVFVSVGQAVQDVVASARILETARAGGLGTRIDWP